MSDLHESHFAVPPMAIPIDDEPLVVYGQDGDTQVRIQVTGKQVTVSEMLGDAWAVIWSGLWLDFLNEFKD